MTFFYLESLVSFENVAPELEGGRPNSGRLNDIQAEERAAQLRVKYLSTASGDDLPAKGTFLVVY